VLVIHVKIDIILIIGVRIVVEAVAFWMVGTESISRLPVDIHIDIASLNTNRGSAVLMVGIDLEIILVIGVGIIIIVEPVALGVIILELLSPLAVGVDVDIDIASLNLAAHGRLASVTVYIEVDIVFVV
jgi:hypothetical protein